MLVMKFGGTSLGDAATIAGVAQIIQRQARDPSGAGRPGVVVVTSAMSGVTNTLIEAVRAAAVGDEGPYREARSQLLIKHLEVAGRLIENTDQRAALGRLLDERLREFERLCHSIAVLGELTQRGLDVVSGLGEQLSAPLLAAVLRAQQVDSELVDAREIIITDQAHGGATPLMNPTTQRCQARLVPMLRRGIVPVLGGFIGATEHGIPTTLGRGGSDYSASILGAALPADEIQIWTDVDGVMTADPRIVPNARSLPEVTYEEVAELSYFGAKVLHPKTVLPAMENSIPLHVRNTTNTSHPGTRIVRRGSSPAKGSAKAITVIRDMNLITVAGRGMLGVPGIAARTFSSVAGVAANVLMISQGSSEQSICFVVPGRDSQTVLDALTHEFERELTRHYIDEIRGHSDIVIVAVVGSGMRGTPGIAAKIFGALGSHGINVIAIAQGSSEVNVSLVVSEGDADNAVRAIHDAFRLDKEPR